MNTSISTKTENCSDAQANTVSGSPGTIFHKDAEAQGQLADWKEKPASMKEAHTRTLATEAGDLADLEWWLGHVSDNFKEGSAWLTDMRKEILDRQHCVAAAKSAHRTWSALKDQQAECPSLEGCSQLITARDKCEKQSDEAVRFIGPIKFSTDFTVYF